LKAANVSVEPIWPSELLIVNSIFNFNYSLIICTRKPSLTEARRTTAVSVWRPLARNLRHINAGNSILRSTFSGLQRCRWQYGCILFGPKSAKFEENSNL